MTISSIETVARYVGDGVQEDWPIPFAFFKAEDISVIEVLDSGLRQDLVFGTDYTVSAVNAVEGGTLHYCASDNATLLVYRSIPFTQEMDLCNTGILDAEALERGYDRLTLMIQQVDEKIERAVKVDITSTVNPDDIIEDMYASLNASLSAASSAETHATQAGGAALACTQAQAVAEDARDEVLSQLTGISSFFRGMIVPFVGSFGGEGNKHPINPVKNIADSAWALCDGTNGTPNLQDRFIVGAGATYTAGTIGGSTSSELTGTTDATTLTEAHMPSHGQHVTETGSVGNSYLGGSAHSTKYRTGSLAWGAKGSNTAHTHGLGSTTISTMPPYYALAYIMKL